MERRPTPRGKDPGDPGDCDNPRSLTIHLHEDRWGNHGVVVLQGNEVKHRGLIAHRGLKPAPCRRPFSASADILRAVLREVERGE